MLIETLNGSVSSPMAWSFLLYVRILGALCMLKMLSIRRQVLQNKTYFMIMMLLSIFINATKMAIVVSVC